MRSRDQHEFDRTHRHAIARHTDEPLGPNRQTKSSGLNAPTHPIASGLIQRKASNSSEPAEGAESALALAASSSGAALPDSIKNKFEASLGADLSSVRIHTNPQSAIAAAAVGAKAYAIGQDIHFGAGQYDPSSSDGELLLAHEVAHTVQQRGAPPVRHHKLNVSSPHDAAEHEADRAAEAMVAGQRAAIGPTAGLGQAISSGVSANIHKKEYSRERYSRQCAMRWLARTGRTLPSG